MIYDSEEHKRFIIECVRNFQCRLGDHEAIMKRFGRDVENGQILPKGKKVEFVDAPPPERGKPEND